MGRILPFIAHIYEEEEDKLPYELSKEPVVVVVGAGGNIERMPL
jgi:hypothetical protein